MDIKLRARLSAYSKVDSIGHLQTFIPDPTSAADGTVLGVDTGKYTLLSALNTGDIDNMFQESSVTVVGKDQIDELFADATEPQSVTKDEIDKLFQTVENPDSVTKEEIDDLFEKDTSQAEDIGTVSFTDIDKLFS